MLSPKRTKFRKVQKGRIKGKAARGNKITKGEFGIVALEPTWITANQIEATRVTLSRYTKKVGKVYIDIFPDKPITKKPAEVRMGKGKGAPDHWAAVIKPGMRFCDIDAQARDLIDEAGYSEYWRIRLGHFIGQEDHEYGDVSPINKNVAEPGMVFSIEPGIYIEGKYGVRVEDLVLVTEDGHELLNAVDKKYRIVG